MRFLRLPDQRRWVAAIMSLFLLLFLVGIWSTDHTEWASHHGMYAYSSVDYGAFHFATRKSVVPVGWRAEQTDAKPEHEFTIHPRGMLISIGCTLGGIAWWLFVVGVLCYRRPDSTIRQAADAGRSLLRDGGLHHLRPAGGPDVSR